MKNEEEQQHDTSVICYSKGKLFCRSGEEIFRIELNEVNGSVEYVCDIGSDFFWRVFLEGMRHEK